VHAKFTLDPELLSQFELQRNVRAAVWQHCALIYITRSFALER